MKTIANTGTRHFLFSLKRLLEWVSLLLLIAMQQEPYAAGGEMRGSGTEAEPFLIEDYADLLKVGVDSTSYALHSVYRLTKNIDGAASKTENRGAGFAPIGRYAKVFSGVFHGAGYTISNLTIQEGFFGFVQGGQIDSLGLRNISAKGTNIHAGGLASTNRAGSITGCYTTGSVTSNGRTGGLVGQNIGGTLTYCYSTCTVNGNSCSGGLVGWNDSGSIVRHSFATGFIHGNIQVGGLIGMNSTSLVEGCYSTGILTHDCTWAGGLIGYNAAGKVIGCYTSGGIFKSSRGAEVCGGLCGINSPLGTITGCYWNTENSGKVTGVGIDSGASAIKGLSTQQMKQSSSFSNWDFVDWWISPSDSTYPGLRNLPNGPFAMVDTPISMPLLRVPTMATADLYLSVLFIPVSPVTCREPAMQSGIYTSIVPKSI